MYNCYTTKDGNEVRPPDRDGEIELIYDNEYDDGVYLSKKDVMEMLKLFDTGPHLTEK